MPTAGTLEPGVDFVIPPQGSQFQPERVLGIIHEFRIAGTPGHAVSIRTVASATTDFGGPNINIFGESEPDSPPKKPIVHQRGSWTYSQLLITMSGVAFDAAGTTQSEKFRRGCGENAGVEVQAYKKREGDTHGSAFGNKALRGVLCRYRVRAENTDISHGREIAAFLRARNTNNFWQGAALAFEEEPSSVRAGVVLPIWSDTNPVHADKQGVKLNQTQIGAGPSEREITVRIVHGSSGSLPVDLVYWSGPVAAPIDPPPGDDE